MTPPRIIGLVLLAVGAVLLVFAYNASQSTGEQLLETFTGRYSDSTTWYIVSGIACVIGGGGMLAFGMKK